MNSFLVLSFSLKVNPASCTWRNLKEQFRPRRKSKLFLNLHELRRCLHLAYTYLTYWKHLFLKSLNSKDLFIFLILISRSLAFTLRPQHCARVCLRECAVFGHHSNELFVTHTAVTTLFPPPGGGGSSSHANFKFKLTPQQKLLNIDVARKSCAAMNGRLVGEALDIPEYYEWVIIVWVSMNDKYAAEAHWVTSLGNH